MSPADRDHTRDAWQDVGVVTVDEIVTFDDRPAPAGESAWIEGHGPTTEVRVVAADPTWPEQYARFAAVITGALGDRLVTIEHVGSTSVPELPAKPVIDIDLSVPDAADEPAYVPPLERNGFTLVAREPWLDEHRLLRGPDQACNVHVFAPGSAEPERHRIFRDWLRAHPDDRSLYAEIKLRAAEQTQAAGGHTMDYNANKQQVVREIYGRAFRSLGLLSST
jgi:GrpB-like predicted nucleotidyltransferase (UPF0157 family)